MRACMSLRGRPGGGVDLVAWFLLGPGSSDRAPSLSLEELWLGRAVAQYRLSAARAADAI